MATKISAAPDRGDFEWATARIGHGDYFAAVVEQNLDQVAIFRTLK